MDFRKIVNEISDDEYDDTCTWGGKRHEWGDNHGNLCWRGGPWVSREQCHYLQNLRDEISKEFGVECYDSHNLFCVSKKGIPEEEQEDFIQEILDNYPELEYVETGKHWFKFALNEDEFVEFLRDNDVFGGAVEPDMDYSALKQESRKTMKFKKIVKEGAREEWEDLKAHWTASRKPKGQKEFDQAAEWNRAHPEMTCDRCGFSSRNEDYFGIEGDEVLCDKCRRGMVNESGPTIRKKIDGKTVKGWYEWLKKENMGCCHLSVGQTAKNDICICMGWHDDGEDGEIAWKIGQQSFRNAMQTDLDVDFDMPYDPETGDVYDTLSYLDDVDPETFDWNGLADEMNRTAQEVYEYACEVDGTDEDDIYNEGLQEDVLGMPDRVEELDEEIDRLWRRLGDVDDKTVSQLILACIEFEKLKPGRIVDALGDYANFTEK